MNLRKLTFTDLAEDAGLQRQTMSDWRYRRQPTVENLEAALNAMGYRLQIVEITEPSLDKASYNRVHWLKRRAAA